MQDTIEFSTGMLIVAEDSISFQSESGKLSENQSMKRHHIGNVNHQHFVYLKRMPIQYGFRIGLLGLVISIAGSIIYSSNPDKQMIPSLIGGTALCFGLFLVFGDLVIDGLFGSTFVRRITQLAFGQKGYAITVTNESGADNLEFFIGLDELEKTKVIESFRTEIKEPPVVISQVVTSTTSNLDELKKLGELKDLGIITTDEFEQKKKQLLNS